MFHTSAHNIFMENKQTELLVKINENYFRSNTQKNNLWRIVYVFEKVHEQIGQILFKNFLVQATYEGKEQRIEELKNLTNASLRFRLLRQEGHLISSGKSSPPPYLTKITCHLEFSYYCYNGYIY